MKSITQLHDFGCGVACVAYVANSNYGAMIRLLGKKQAAQRGFYCAELVDCLKQLGFDYEWRFITPRLRQNIYNEKTIIYLKRSKLYPAGHYVARTKDGWMDPWINFRESKRISEAKSGFIRELPYQPSYIVQPLS